MNAPRNKIILFTSSFPYWDPTEGIFLRPEIEYLCRHFSEIIIVPFNMNGMEYPIYEIHRNIVIETGLAKKRKEVRHKIVSMIKGLLSSNLYKEIYQNLNLMLRSRSWIRMLSYYSNAVLVSNWLCRFIRQKQIDVETTIFYTYWFDAATIGIVFLKSAFPGLTLVTRAHGVDLFSERHDPPYLPFRNLTMGAIDHFFLVSHAGREYLLKAYPRYSRLYSVAPLGIEDPGFITEPSRDNIFRIVSCSMLRPEKRVHLIVLSLSRLGRLREMDRFEWCHFGDGPLKTSIERLAEIQIPKNVRCRFFGYVPNHEVLEYYKKHNVDVFIQLSESEGRPLSVMEAQGCGIPVIATSVGGILEIVTHDNGVLLPPHPQPIEVAEAIIRIKEDNESLRSKKRESRRTWIEMSDAAKVFTDFVNQLKRVRNRNG